MDGEPVAASAPSSAGGAAAILSASGQAVSQVILLAAAGAWLEATGKMGPVRRAALSNVAFYVLLPSLLFTNIAESASADALVRQYALPLYSAAFVTIGWTAGALLAPRVVTDGDEFTSTHFIFSCALNNVGYLCVESAGGRS